MPEPAPAPLVFLVGAPRSGTTWLAKIIDSHPGVLYRHEPDDALPLPADAAAADIRAVVARWCAHRSPRSAGKRPFFRKAYWRPWQSWLHQALAVAAAASRSPLWPAIPDLTRRRPACIAIKSIQAGAAAGTLARLYPESRVLFILRHPCGQVASVMRGARLRRFALRTEGTDMPFDEAATLRHAAGFNVGESAFQALPEAARYAWAWRACNEPACAGLAGRPNARILSYEALCASPASEARGVLGFCGLDWTAQTEDFVRRSTQHAGAPGYYAVFRHAARAAEAWRAELSAEDRAAIRGVVAGSPLAVRWPNDVK